MFSASRISRASLIYTVGDFLTRGAGLILIPLYTRYLTAEEVGTLALLQSVIIILQVLFEMGMAGSITRFYVDYEKSSRNQADVFAASIWWSSLVVKSGFCLLVIIAAYYFGSYFFPEVSVGYLVIGVFIAFFQSTFAIPLARYAIREEPLLHRTFSFFQFFTTTLLIIFAVVFLELGVWGVLLAQLISCALWAGIAAWVVTKPANIQFRQLFKNPTDAFRFSIPLVPHRLFQWALGFSDRWILALFVPVAAIGLYSIGYQLATILSTVSLAINKAWMPGFLRQVSSTEESKKSFGQFATYLLLVTLFTALGLILFSPEIIRIVATSKYLPSVPIMRVVVVAYLFHAMYLIPVGPIFHKKKTISIPLITGTAMLMNIATNFLLVPRLGIIGSAWATLVGYIVMAAMAFILSRHYYHVRYEYGRILVLFLIAFVIGFFGIQLSFENYVIAILIKLALLVSFPVIIWFMPGFLSCKERDRIHLALTSLPISR